MTLNSVIDLILRYFTEFDIFGGRLRHEGWRYTYKVGWRISSSSYILATTDLRSSRTVSLRQLSLLFTFCYVRNCRAASWCLCARCEPCGHDVITAGYVLLSF